MKHFLYMFLLSLTGAITIFDFNTDSDMSAWRVVDDIVMGGRSDGSLTLNDQGHAVFKGHVSLENNGGFSSIRYPFQMIKTEEFSRVILRVKGDGKRYQFRVKDRQNTYYSYIHYFETSGEWEEISIPLKDMYPSFRGRKLGIPNFDKTTIEEIGILIANYKEQDFELWIDKISLQ